MAIDSDIASHSDDVLLRQLNNSLVHEHWAIMLEHAC